MWLSLKLGRSPFVLVLCSNSHPIASWSLQITALCSLHNIWPFTSSPQHTAFCTHHIHTITFVHSCLWIHSSRLTYPVYTYTHINTHIGSHTGIHVHRLTYSSMHLCAYLCTHSHILLSFPLPSTCTQIYMYICTQTHVHIYIHSCTDMHRYTQSHIYKEVGHW